MHAGASTQGAMRLKDGWGYKSPKFPLMPQFEQPPLPSIPKQSSSFRKSTHNPQPPLPTTAKMSFSTLTNTAAWIPAKATPMVVKEAPVPTPTANEVLIRAHAVAINPADGVIQNLGLLIASWPTIGGCDVAGVIAAVGSSVTRFKEGDRVLAAMDYFSDREVKGCFQEYSATNQWFTAKLPENVSFVEGSVLPICFNTAVTSLYQKSGLALPWPRLEPQATGKVFIVWGGSSSVGSNAMQLARASGFEVAATCGSHNVEFCKSLGAKWVFDRSAENVVEQVLKALEGRELAGIYDAVFPDLEKCAAIARGMEGKRHIATVYTGVGPLVVPEFEGVETSYSKSFPEITRVPDMRWGLGILLMIWLICSLR
jgi:NADPH:quinone reductase-like Zn-dependent oxidoreductase